MKLSGRVASARRARRDKSVDERRIWWLGLVNIHIWNTVHAYYDDHDCEINGADANDAGSEETEAFAEVTASRQASPRRTICECCVGGFCLPYIYVSICTLFLRVQKRAMMCFRFARLFKTVGSMTIPCNLQQIARFHIHILILAFIPLIPLNKGPKVNIKHDRNNAYDICRTKKQGIYLNIRALMMSHNLIINVGHMNSNLLFHILFVLYSNYFSKWPCILSHIHTYIFCVCVRDPFTLSAACINGYCTCQMFAALCHTNHDNIDHEFRAASVRWRDNAPWRCQHWRWDFWRRLPTKLYVVATDGLAVDGICHTTACAGSEFIYATTRRFAPLLVRYFRITHIEIDAYSVYITCVASNG